MPFDIAHLMPRISDLADYYAFEIGPEQRGRIEKAATLLQATGLEELRQAAHSAAIRVLADPREEPGQPYLPRQPVTDYRILASDGSDIDPDPHLPIPYALIHTAVVGLAYNPPACWVSPHVTFRFRREDLQIILSPDREPIPIDRLVIDTLRAYEEMAALWQEVESLPEDPAGRPLLAMMDGFILWQHRGEKQEEFGERCLGDSVRLLERFQSAGVPLVSFDDTQHYEVVRTLLAVECGRPERMFCSECHTPRPRCLILRDLSDRDLFQFLPPRARSALFQPIYRGETTWRLPASLHARDPRLAFFYVRTGPEIARVELPLWIYEAGLLDLVHAIIVDQCRPRRAERAGYPLALSLAHHEAILTPGDRRNIEWMIEEALARRGIFAAPSAKAQMKGA